VKTRKWYSTNIKPDRTNDLIIMTDMGYIFESIYKNGKFLVSIIKNYKVYFEEWIEQENIIKWMKV
jgi:hypothetical protein